MQRMEMALDEERGAKIHQKKKKRHDTVCVTNTGRERAENDGEHEARKKAS